MIAGLTSITEGDMFFGGKRMNSVEPKDRDIAMYIPVVRTLSAHDGL